MELEYQVERRRNRLTEVLKPAIAFAAGNKWRRTLGQGRQRGAHGGEKLRQRENCFSSLLVCSYLCGFQVGQYFARKLGVVVTVGTTVGNVNTVHKIVAVVFVAEQVIGNM